MKLRISDIQIGHRFRHSVGDVSDLAASIRAVGQLQPVIVDPDFRLLAGARRIAALQSLGRNDVEAVIYDGLLPEANRLRVEADENNHRLAFTNDERAALAEAIEEVESRKAKDRMRAGKANPTQNFGQGRRERSAASIAAKAVGWSDETLRQAKQVRAAIADMKSDGRDYAASRVRKAFDRSVHAAVREVESLRAYPDGEPPKPSRDFQKEYWQFIGAVLSWNLTVEQERLRACEQIDLAL